jgi:hypothetical protein
MRRTAEKCKYRLVSGIGGEAAFNFENAVRAVTAAPARLAPPPRSHVPQAHWRERDNKDLIR